MNDLFGDNLLIEMDAFYNILDQQWFFFEIHFDLTEKKVIGLVESQGL